MFIWVNVSDPTRSDGGERETKRERGISNFSCCSCTACIVPKSHPYSLIHVLIGQAASNSLLSIPSGPPPPSLPSLPPSLSRPLSPRSSSVNESSQTQAVQRHSLARSHSLIVSRSLVFPLSGADGSGASRDRRDGRRRQTSLSNLHSTSVTALHSTSELKQQIVSRCSCRCSRRSAS